MRLKTTGVRMRYRGVQVKWMAFLRASLRAWLRALSVLSASALLGGAVTGCHSLAAFAGQSASEQPLVRIVSAPNPAWISGGDLLLHSDAAALTFSVGQRSIAHEMFAATQPDQHGYFYRLMGLADGEFQLRVQHEERVVAELTATTYPLQGPMFAGPWQAPFFCQTQTFLVGPGLGDLGLSAPPACVVPDRIDHVRLKVDGQFLAVDASSVDASSDGASSDGASSPNGDRVMRVWTGVINRAVFQVAMPVTHSDEQVSPGTRSAAWNGKLIYKFGGGCRGGWYRQGDATAGVLDADLLQHGYAVASASLNVFGNNCNDLLAAETMAMVKEHFIETFGPPLFTIGFGCSGGSYQGLQLGDNYPGLLDGILVGCSFPEVGHGMATVLFDARLLQRYFQWANDGTEVHWTAAEQLAVTGLANADNLTATAEGAARLDATSRSDRTSAEFSDVVPLSARFDPVHRATGARATVFDHTVNVYGRDANTGFARWPLDNRGIEYGRSAWRSGAISDAQFLHLNRHIGGLDRDGNFTATRTTHDVEATQAAYRTGRILDGGVGLARIPIVDYRAWADAKAGGDTHLAYHSQSIRLRLLKANGSLANYVALTEDGSCNDCPLFSLKSPQLAYALDGLDRWLVALSTGAAANDSARLAATRPADLQDSCWIDGRREVDAQVPGGRCAARFPFFSFPRAVSGAPLSNDVVACTRGPISAVQYPGASATMLEELRGIFPGGVCDYGQPAEGRVTHAGPWQSLGPAALGQ